MTRYRHGAAIHGHSPAGCRQFQRVHGVANGMATEAALVVDTAYIYTGTGKIEWVLLVQLVTALGLAERAATRRVSSNTMRCPVKTNGALHWAPKRFRPPKLVCDGRQRKAQCNA